MFGWDNLSRQEISEANNICVFLSKRRLLRILTATRSGQSEKQQRTRRQRVQVKHCMKWKVYYIQDGYSG